MNLNTKKESEVLDDVFYMIDYMQDRCWSTQDRLAFDRIYSKLHEQKMIDNPLPDQVMEARDVFYNHQEVEEVIRNHAKIIAEHFKVHPDLHDEFADWYYDFICQNPDLFQSFSINLDSDYIVDWWEDYSYLYDDFDSPYMEIKK